MTLIGGGLDFGDPGIALFPTLGPLLLDPGDPGGTEASAATILSTVQGAAGHIDLQISSAVLGIAPGEWEIVNSVTPQPEERIEIVVRFILDVIEVVEEIRRLRALEQLAQIYAEMIGQWIAYQQRIAALLSGLPTVAEALRSFRLFGGMLQQVAQLFARGEGCVALLLQNLNDPLFRVTVVLGPEGEETQTAFHRFLQTMLPLTIPSGLVFPGSIPANSDVWRHVRLQVTQQPAQQSPLSILDRLVTLLNERARACSLGRQNACDDLTARAAALNTFWTGERIQDPGIPDPSMRVEERWGGGFGVAALIERACVAAEDLGAAIINFEPFGVASGDLALQFGPRPTITTPQGVGGAVCP
ncbi:MAG: hypothetical protein V3T14_00130 [Myxococcota bacterium]